MNNDLEYRNKVSIARERQLASKYEVCKIESLSPQGDSLFAICRRLDRIVLDKNGKPQKVKGILIGNELELDEKELLLAEVLIPTDIDLSRTYFNPEDYIGKNVYAEFINGIPSEIKLKEILKNARSISRMDIVKARSASPDNSLSSKEAIKYLESQGYTRAQIRAVSEEKLDSIKPQGHILKYGNIAAWHNGAASDARDEKDLSMSVRRNIVKNLPSANMKTKDCHRPVIILGGNK